ncbi:MAG: tRNA (adenosine(37)-N6)-threonylcarbamoyltransferase complex dimerization subunit type 1 TsaB [Actinomycetes bacterium]
MLILGIETATERVSVAIGGHEGVLGMFEVTRGRRHAETLTPAIDLVGRQAAVTLDEISVGAVDMGPGLFTGMRVGLASAKAIAQALRVPMIAISSLDLLA